FDNGAPRGLGFSPDGHTLYVAENAAAPEGRRELRAYPVGPDGAPGPSKILLEAAANEMIDGLCVDADGNVLACIGLQEGGDGRIAVVSPEGKLLETQTVPGSRPTNCAF